MPAPTVRADLTAALGMAARRLAAAGVPSPRFDAEALAAHVLGVPRTRLIADADRFDAAAAGALAALVDRRAERVPLQHLTGTAPFRTVELAVGPGVFVPRPETELVAGAAVDAAAAVAAAGEVPVVVDLATGSGAIALAVATEVPAAVVHAVEVDPAAADWAARNLADLGPRVHLHRQDLADPLPALVGVVDVVVSNPPYVPEGSRIRDPEVVEHDPALALWGGGADGLGVMRQVVAAAERLLRAGGWLVVEHADVQGESVPALLTARPGWSEVVDHRDLAGRPRWTTAVWQRAA